MDQEKRMEQLRKIRPKICPFKKDVCKTNCALWNEEKEKCGILTMGEK